ncbi:hypothetical protein DJ030_12890 [bacterium endosymbiont of Escarpia laminata]|nr:MAG: hypothetical protein DJ030_12890 [bacterium endosymbiont of Escarpia laminata]
MMNKKSKKHAHLEKTMSVSDAIQIILRHNLDYLAEWEQAARCLDDIEGVHQTRVAFRRMRSALTIFRMVIPKEVSKTWADKMRDLAGQLGRARDLDVFIDEALSSIHGKLPLPGAAGLEALVYKQRETVHEEVHSMFDSEQYARFKTEFGRWVDNRGWEQADLKKKQHKLREGSLISFAFKVLDRQERRVLEAGAHVNKHSAKDMHRLRIECKKLRYATEFFFPIFAGMDEFIGHMKGLQDLLGVMNDVAVMYDMLEELLAGAKDPEVQQYAGGIMGWRSCYYNELLFGFDRRWEEFVDAKHPWWKKAALAQYNPINMEAE